ncbi:MAG TPA: serine/threonine-protein kinase [Blastocatellia bacterium]|jgi:serine/threonine protein kinase|nr:serine/threonine-protein kinase [Blastocatellia bacterium]
MVCPNCGNVSDDNRFCNRCDAELAPPLALAAAASDVVTSPSAVSRPTDSGALTGRTLDQKYYLETKLGVGGMGTVYRAGRLLIGDWVAVKVLHPDQMTDPQAVERFRREAQLGARLKHPNVVTVYDFVISSEGLSYLVMDLAEGENLGSLIERQGALAETDAAEIILQVCAALDEAHRQGVVHRDIKPQNIIVQTTPEGLQVKMLDFGATASRDVTTSKLTRTGAIVSTPDYMSPEHCLGEELDGRSDIYSLGIVLFEMLTGVAPFDSPTPTATVIKHVNDSPPPPRTLNPNISPAVEAVTLRALEKRRDARPQTAGEMARELIAATPGAELDSPHSTMVAASGVITSEPITTAILEEVATPESNSSMATLLDGVPAFGEMYAKTWSSGKLVLLVFGALLLLAGGGAGLWWYVQKSAIEKVAATRDSAGSSQGASTVSGQPAAPDRGATASPSAAPAPSMAIPASNKLWELIPDQTTGVADVANALGAADRRLAVISPGGQLALEYREGKFFGDGHGADLRVYGPERGQVSYLIFVRNDPAEDWMRIDINRKGFPHGEVGHDMGHHGIRQARQVMIKNIGNNDLRIDAVSVIYKDGVYSEIATRHRH